jgi:hypothetical protein
MGFPGRMFQGFFQFGRESIWGTDVAATHRLRFLKLTPEPTLETIDSDVMDGTGLLLSRYAGKKVVKFTTEHELTHTNFLPIWDLLMGTGTFGNRGGATTGPAGADYTHVFKHKDLLNSVTAEIGMGDPNNSPPSKVEQVVGAKLVAANLSGAFHERGRARLTWEGKDYSNGVTPTSLASPATNDCVLFDSLSAFNDGIGSTGDLLGFELAVDNKAPGRDFASSLIDEPIRQDFPEMSLMIREEFQSKAALDAQLAKTSGVPSLTFTSGAKILTLAFGAADLTEPVTREPEGRGRIIQNLNWKPVAAGSPSTYLTVTQVNTQATIPTYT